MSKCSTVFYKMKALTFFKAPLSTNNKMYYLFHLMCFFNIYHSTKRSITAATTKRNKFIIPIPHAPKKMLMLRLFNGCNRVANVYSLK